MHCFLYLDGYERGRQSQAGPCSGSAQSRLVSENRFFKKWAFQAACQLVGSHTHIHMTPYQLRDIPDIKGNLNESPVASDADVLTAVMIWVSQAD